MKQLVLYVVLLGMVLINAPKSFLHDCAHETHCHTFSCCDDDHEENNLSIDSADCDLCAYTFHSIDTPSFPLISISTNACYLPLAMHYTYTSVGAIHYLQLRGPPTFVTI